jgi:hypothetical protein
MDRDRFDALARLLATTGSRRAALGALLATGLLGRDPDALAKPRKRTGKDRGPDRDKDQNTAKSRDRDAERRSDSRLQAEGRNQGRKRRKGKKKQRGGKDADGGHSPAPLTGVCCDAARHCADPESGSTRAGCDFAERDFSGADHNGSIFRGIDGRDATFDDTDNHGSVFAGACLRRASFRGANLEGTTWDGACLFGVDFTGADLGGDSAVFAGAIFCATVMPDGARNDRDCDRSEAFPCCLPPPGGGGGGGEPCSRPADCPDQACQTKACTGGTCRYTPVANGPSPNALCDGHCCRGMCCAPGATRCNPSGQCCAPNCAGRQCGPDGCGGDGTCGTCPSHLACNDANGQCVCDARVCPTGCCAGDGSCQPGTTDQLCGSRGSRCRTCSAGRTCRNGSCECTPQLCPNGCCFNGGGDGLCEPGNARGLCGKNGEVCKICFEDQACHDGQCVCDPQLCQRGQECAANRCACTPHSCPNGCCHPDIGDCREGNTNVFCGTGGATCARCGAGQTCVNGRCACTPQSCPNGCCDGDHCLPGESNQKCGRNGDPCQFCPLCFHGWCDCNRQTCPHGCCSGDDFSGFCQEGTTPQLCGGPPAQHGGDRCQVCRPGQLCIDHRCTCTPQSCPAGQLCVDGQCATCSPSCPCVGQSVCHTNKGDPNEPTTVCKRNPANGATCFCMVSRTGQPICAGPLDFVPPCETDADCQADDPRSVCVAAVPGSDICGIAGNFCASPCDF